MKTYLVLEEDYRNSIPCISVTETDTRINAERIMEQAIQRYDIPSDNRMLLTATKKGLFYDRKDEYGNGYLLIKIIANDEVFSW